MKSIIAVTILLVGLLQLWGCGGGGGSSSGPPTRTSVAFSLVSTSNLPFRINAFEFTVNLPPGITPVTDNPTGKGNIISGLSLGGAVPASGLGVFGSYSAPKVRIVFAYADSSGSGFGPGEMVRLTCNLSSAAQLDQISPASALTGLAWDARGTDTRPEATSDAASLAGYLTPVLGFTLLP